MKKKYLAYNNIGFLEQTNDNILRTGHVSVWVIIAFELLMTAYGLVSFDFSHFTSAVYLVLYGFLIFASVCILVFRRMYLAGKVGLSPRAVRAVIMTYVVCLLAWSLSISIIDCFDGGFCIVLLTVAFGISGGVLLYPAESVPMLTAAFVIFVATSWFTESMYISLSYVINLFVFYMFTLIVSHVHYVSGKKQYLAKKKLEDQNEKLNKLIEQLSETNSRLAFISETDMLTGVSCRNGIQQRFNTYRGMEKPVSLAMLDLDNFKKINDTYGHTEGDRCLAGVAEILLSYAEKADVFRFGGEEFLLLLQQDSREAEELVRSICRNTENAAFGEAGIKLTVSAGIYTPEAGNGEELDRCIGKADKAMYLSKADGKNRVTVYSGDTFQTGNI